MAFLAFLASQPMAARFPWLSLDWDTWLVVFGFFCLVFLGEVCFASPYRLHRRDQNEINEWKTKYAKLENDSVTLTISAHKGNVSGTPRYFINVQNSHKWKSAHKVKVFLDAITNPDLGPIRASLPRRLPLIKEYDIRDCDIDAFPSSQEFELFYAKSQVGLAWFLSFAPCVTVPLSGIQSSSDIVIKTGSLSLDDTPNPSPVTDDEFLVTVRAQAENIKPEIAQFKVTVLSPNKGYSEPEITQITPPSSILDKP